LRHWSVRSHSAAETRELGRLLGALLAEPATLLLLGDLGAGKTCFVQGVADGLGVPAAEPVTSPTFALMNQYRGRFPLYHFDLYRLAPGGEVDDLDLEGYLAGEGVAVVEWAERLPMRERGGIEIDFVHAGDDERTLRFSARGAAAEAILVGLSRCWRERGLR
jgi:tRNA threonylcarbamoyladenosine biosynthesis protein TsaE